MSEGYNAYITYLAMKSHFTQDNYDFFKYQGKVRASYDTFNKRRDKHFFLKLEKNYGKNLAQFLAANFYRDGPVYVNSLFNKRAKELYDDFVHRQESLSYWFRCQLEDLVSLCDEEDITFRELVTHNGRDNPRFFVLMLECVVEPETFLILNELCPFVSSWNNHMEHDPVWRKMKFNLKKYAPFVKYDVEKCKYILEKTVDNRQRIVV